MKEECYRCDEAATSREHVPAKCLFPIALEIGEDLRKDLITVPSCDAHNSAKSLDDEFLMVSLAGIIGNNSIGYAHKLGKVDRALRRRCYKLLDKVLLNRQTIDRIEMGNNRFLEILWGTPDKDRLTSALEAIAYGLHLHHFEQRFVGRVKVHFGYLRYEEGNSREWNSFIQERCALDLEGKPVQGANPGVFQYQVSDKDQYGLYIMRLKFYGGLDVYVAFIPEGTQLPQSPIELSLRAGLKTIVTLGDKKYVLTPREGVS